MASPTVDVSAPYVLFPLPLPLHQTRSKDKEGVSYRACFTAPVESRKRKRDASSEISAVIDGEGLNIYDIQSQKTVSSHALPPTTRFSCAPASSVTRISNSCICRRTYAAVSLPKRQIICWEDTVPTTVQPGDSEIPAKEWSRNNDSRHDVVFLQDLNHSARRGKNIDVDTGLLAVYADGQVKLFTEDLEAEKWVFSIPSSKNGPRGSRVVYVTTTTITKAKKAIFKNRPDISLPTVAEESNGVDDIILFTIIQADNDFSARMINVPLNAARKPRQLVELTLPVPNPSKSNRNVKSPASFSLHAPTGTLYQLYNNQLSTYNFSTAVPTVISTIDLQSASSTDSHPVSMVRVSSSSVLVSTNDDVALYDTKFASLQARATLRPFPSSRASTPATPNSSSTGSVTLTSFIPELDLAIGHSQIGLVGVQLTRARRKDGQPLRPRKGGLLVDSLCRGVRGLRFQKDNAIKFQGRAKEGTQISEARNRERQRVLETIAKLQKARGDQSIAEFEKTFASYVGVQQPNELTKINGNTDVPMTNGVDEDSSKENRDDLQAVVRVNGASEPSDLGDAISEAYYKPLRTDLVTSILSMIFTVASGDDGEKLEVSFYPPNVMKYLVESRNFPTISLPRQTGLVEALVVFDPTLRTLSWFISALADFPVAEVVSAISIALAETSTPKGENSLIQEIHRTEVLRLALIRLSSCPSPLAVKALRVVPGETLLSLANILQKELSGAESGVDEIGIELGSTGLVADLLTTVLDAIGVAGIILSETGDMLTSMQRVVTQSLGAIEEVIVMKGLLEELFRHVDWEVVKERERTIAELERNKKEKIAKKNARRKAKRVAALGISTETELIKTVERTKAPQPLPKKKPASMLSRRAQKSRRGRADADVRKAMLERINAKRRQAIAQEKKQKKQGAAAKKKDNSLLPLGVASLRPIIDPSFGRAVPGPSGRINPRIQHWREGLTAGVYSVETVVI